MRILVLLVCPATVTFTTGLMLTPGSCRPSITRTRICSRRGRKGRAQRAAGVGTGHCPGTPPGTHQHPGPPRGTPKRMHQDPDTPRGMHQDPDTPRRMHPNLPTPHLEVLRLVGQGLFGRAPPAPHPVDVVHRGLAGQRGGLGSRWPRGRGLRLVPRGRPVLSLLLLGGRLCAGQGAGRLLRGLRVGRGGRVPPCRPRGALITGDRVGLSSPRRWLRGGRRREEGSSARRGGVGHLQDEESLGRK